MGFFFLNKILGKEHEERRRKAKGHNGQGKRQKRRYSSSSSHLDRLPDEILVHILSFMSTRDCVRSSTLGKRWRLLWARVPDLVFHSCSHKNLSSFINFFNRFVFVHKGHSIYSFSFEYYDWEDSEYKSEIETLIATAIACNVQDIDILSGGYELVLPQALFTCTTLVDLTLTCPNCICADEVRDGPRMVPRPMTGTSSVVYLPALEKLELIRMLRYESEESFVRLLSGCPALEELTIHKENDDVFCLHISSPTLTRLNLEMQNHDVFDNNYRELKLDTPALEYLKLRDSLSRHFSAGMLASLTEADVYFNLRDDDVDPHSVLEFVGKLNNVSRLKLTTSYELRSAWTDSTLTSTEFPNLTKLELDGDWRFFTTFLQNSDNLQFFSVAIDDKSRNWVEPKQVPVCLISHLRTVWFRCFKCSEAQLNMVKYVLKNAKVLTMMRIHATCYRGDLKEKKEALERIPLFERASEACHFTLKFNSESLVVG